MHVLAPFETGQNAAWGAIGMGGDRVREATEHGAKLTMANGMGGDRAREGTEHGVKLKMASTQRRLQKTARA